MAGFFKSVFGKRSAGVKQEIPLTYEQLKGVPFDQLLKVLNSLKPEAMTFGPTHAIFRRLQEIALIDNHVPEEQRDTARKLADALAADLEILFSNDPQKLALFKTEVDETRELARRGGYGSLVWRLNEYPMSSAEVLPYVMKPEHRHLVPDFLEIMGPDKIASMKHLMVQQLVLQAGYNSQNSVLILHGLATKGDKAAAALLTSDEYAALLNVPGNYAGGRGVLVGLGILPEVSDAIPFKPVSEIKDVLESLHDLLREMHERAEADPRVIGLSEDKKYALLLTLDFLRVELATALLCQIYGEESAYDVVTIFSDPAVIEQLGRFREVAQVLKKMTPGTPVEWALLDAVMSSGGIEAKSEEEFNSSREFFDLGVAWLNKERVEFLDHLRSRLRPVANEQEDLVGAYG